jgi:hypothetical protein
VSITWFDAPRVREELLRSVRELTREHPEIQRVVLFGSLAAGRPVPGSDADLLVILEDSDRPFLDRIPLYVPAGCSVGVDVFPYTVRELEAMQAAGNAFLRDALAGLELFPGPS